MVAAGLSRKHLIGLAFVLLVAGIWVGASFITQYLVQEQLSPFLLSCICTSLFTIYLPLLHIKRHCAARRKQHAAPQGDSAGTSGGSTPWLSVHGSSQDHGSTTQQASLLAPLLTDDTPGAADGAAGRQVPGSRTGGMSLFKAALVVGPLWLLSSLLFNLSLANTSVTSNTILSSSSSLFTYVLSVLVLGERPTAQKATSVMLVMGGTALVTLSDTTGSESGVQRSLLGDAMAVSAAAAYACYTVILRHVLGEDNTDGVAELFGYCGLMTLLGVVPVLAGAQLLGTLDLRSLSANTLQLALLTGLLDYVVSDYLWARAVLLIGPTAATLGLNIQIPLATAVDLAKGQPRWLDTSTTIAMAAGGTAAILLGVAGINLSLCESERKEHEPGARGVAGRGNAAAATGQV